MSEIKPNTTTGSAPSPTIRKVMESAEAGNTKAQYALGMCYANGEELPLNYVEAARWIASAAQHGLAEAQSTLGWLHANGFGVEQSDTEAGRWYLEAAHSGLASAQYTVGGMYRWGRYGVERDLTEALTWLRRAAEQNLAAAQFALGRLLAAGREVPEQPVAAFQWLSLAILNGSEPAKETLAELSGRMPPEQVEQAKRELLGRMAGGA